MEPIWKFPVLTDEQKILYHDLRAQPKLSTIPDLSLQHLVRKGFIDVETISKLFFDNFSHLHDFRQLKDATKALGLIKEAILNRQKIIIYSDYDCDGVMGASVGVLGLRYLGANVFHYTNNRFNEGYGMNLKGLKRLFEGDARNPGHKDAGLIITIDNGISVTEEIVQAARQYGAQLVITDHHEPPADGSLPSADAVVNAKRLDETYPFRELCGAGLFYKLLIALAWEMQAEMQPIYELADLAGIATVGDVVPLIDENRIIVKESLRLAKAEKRPIFRFLREASGQSTITEETYGYTYAPLINAVGRITGEVSSVIEMFVSTDEVWQQQMAQWLVDMNTFRKAKTVEQNNLATELMGEQLNEPIIILKHNDFHEGIVGLIAGQLKERFYRPVFIVSEEEEDEEDEHGMPTGRKVLKVKGSARSIDGFHLKDMLDQCKDYLLGYGGHAAAAGLSVDPEKWDDLVIKLRELAAMHLTPELLTPKIDIDMVISEQDLTFDLMDQLNEMRPFGVGFEKPSLALTPLELKTHKYMGGGYKHLRLEGQQHNVILFNYATQYQELGEPNVVEVLGYPDINVWNGQVSIQFKGSQLRRYEEDVEQV